MNIKSGVLLQSRGSVFGENVFFCCDGVRHSTRSSSRIEELGFSWPDDVLQVPESVLKAFLPGGMVPGLWPNSFETEGINSSVDMREIIGCSFHGIGLEFGAGASPFPVSLACTVRYADAFSYESLRAGLYPGQLAHDLIRPDYVADIKTLSGIPDESFDFIVACHVIEHTNNPLAAIGSCHRALKYGGSLALVVPDMAKTFDSKRTLTSLSHLILDYEEPSSDRDREHYEEFYSMAFELPSDVNLFDFAAQKQIEDGDIHYHTFTYESFRDVVEWCAQEQGWTVEYARPTLPGPDNIEFYFVLKKINKKNMSVSTTKCNTV